MSPRIFIHPQVIQEIDAASKENRMHKAILKLFYGTHDVKGWDVEKVRATVSSALEHQASGPQPVGHIVALLRHPEILAISYAVEFIPSRGAIIVCETFLLIWDSESASPPATSLWISRPFP